METAGYIVEFSPQDQGCSANCAHCPMALKKSDGTIIDAVDPKAQATFLRLQEYFVRHGVRSLLQIRTDLGHLDPEVQIDTIPGYRPDQLYVDLDKTEKTAASVWEAVSSILPDMEPAREVCFGVEDNALEIDLSNPEVAVGQLMVLNKLYDSRPGGTDVVCWGVNANNVRHSKFDTLQPGIWLEAGTILVKEISGEDGSVITDTSSDCYSGEWRFGHQKTLNYRYMRAPDRQQQPFPIKDFCNNFAIFPRGILLGHSTYSVGDDFRWVSHEQFLELVETAERQNWPLGDFAAEQVKAQQEQSYRCW